MAGVFATIVASIRTRFGLWLAISVGFVAAYYLFLVAFMVARFGSWPNYVTAYDIVENYRLILAGTPALSDALSLMSDEILIEVGYMHPQFHIAVWSVDLLPVKAAVILLLGAFVATYAVVRGEAADCPLAARRGGAAAGSIGAFLVGLTSATMSWVVCCAVPNWVVSLTMMGVGVSTSFALEPFGLPLMAGGLVLAAAAVLLRARRSRAPAQLPQSLAELRHVH